MKEQVEKTVPKKIPPHITTDPVKTRPSTRAQRAAATNANKALTAQAKTSQKSQTRNKSKG